jgi:hypothetical protein
MRRYSSLRLFDIPRTEDCPATGAGERRTLCETFLRRIDSTGACLHRERFHRRSWVSAGRVVWQITNNKDVRTTGIALTPPVAHYNNARIDLPIPIAADPATTRSDTMLSLRYETDAAIRSENTYAIVINTNMGSWRPAPFHCTPRSGRCRFGLTASMQRPTHSII